MNDYYSSLKICNEKILPKHIDKYNKIKESNHLRAAFFIKKVWPKGTVLKVSFIGNGNNIQRTTYLPTDKVDPLQKTTEGMNIIDSIKKIVKERIEPFSGLTFNFLNDGDTSGDIRIAFSKDSGAWSLIGKDNLKEEKANPTMNFGWYDVATVIHEFGHLIGMVHEHQNVYGNSIQWDKQKVYSWAEKTQGWDKETTDTNILNKYLTSEINGSNFDPGSIMLYFFPAELTLNGIGTKQNTTMSKADVVWIANIYNEKPNASWVSHYKSIYGIDISDSEIDAIKISQVGPAVPQKALGEQLKSWNLYTIIFFLFLLLVAIIIIIYLIKRRPAIKNASKFSPRLSPRLYKRKIS